MKLVNPNSLAQTLDRVNEALFYGKSLPKPQREEVARWIASRQGLPRSYAGMFAPTEGDFKKGIRLFTGERIQTRAGTAHILGEEACRVLILLGASGKAVGKALQRASAGMIDRLRYEKSPGIYCCGKCSVALWRHLAVGGLEHSERRLAAGLKTLKAHRDGSGRWKVFPFHYTLLALSEIDLPTAVKEMRYAAQVCERILKRSAGIDKFAGRRRVLAERILDRC